MAEGLALLAEDPRAVGPYRIEGRLAAGGQGTVYVGRGDDGVLVAVKLLHPHLMADQRARQHFLREAETAKRVAPFCTAQVLDFGLVEGRPYIVSEFVDGPSLQVAVRDDGPRGAAALQRLAVNTATALAAIHEAGVVHRDFKPGNVLLGPDGPVVIDFGIARALDLSQSAVSSQPIGSPAYMAPEQFEGGDVGPACDMFAWGATMVYAATGQRAFAGESIPGIMHAILQGRPDLGGVEGDLRSLLEECLAKDPARRPTALQVIERLRVLPSPAWRAVQAGQPGQAGRAEQAGMGVPGMPAGAGATVPPRKAGGQRGLIMGTAGAALLVTAVIGYFAFSPGASGDPAPEATIAMSPLSPSSSPLGEAVADGTPDPDATERSTSAEPVPSRSAIPRSEPRRTRTPARTEAPAQPTTKQPTRRPTTKQTKPTRTARAQSARTTSPPPAPSQGAITFDDVHEYCRAQGYSMGAGNWNGMTCMGGTSGFGAKNVTPTTVCQWKYPGRDAVAEQPQNGVASEVTCRLS